MIDRRSILIESGARRVDQVVHSLRIVYRLTKLLTAPYLPSDTTIEEVGVRAPA